MGRWQTAGYVPYAGLTAGPPTLVTGAACPAGDNTESYCTITKMPVWCGGSQPGQTARLTF